MTTLPTAARRALAPLVFLGAEVTQAWADAGRERIVLVP
jgi:hypothetical protein